MKQRTLWSTTGISLLVVAIALLPFLPMTAGVPDAHDLPDHVAMTAQYSEGLEEGALYPRWFGSFNLGWGEPTGVFYPPGLYFLSSLLIRVAGLDPLGGLLGALLIMTLIGMIGIYLLARPLAGRWPALSACALLALMPYRGFELYAAGLFAAYAAGCVLPWTLLALWRLASSRSTGAVLRATLAWTFTYALVILLNLPSALLLTYVVAGWIVMEFAVSRDWRPVLGVILGGAGGALLAAVYLVPAIWELPSIVIPHAGAKLYAENFLFQGSGSWMSPGLSSLFTRMGSFPACLFTLAAVAVFWFTLRSSGSRTQRGEDDHEPGCPALSLSSRAWFRLIGIFGLTAFLLATPVSAILWETLPFLRRANMPWRLLDHFAVPTAALGAVALAALLKSRRPFAATLGIASLAVIGFLCFELGVSISEMNGKVGPERTQDLVLRFYGRTGYFLPQGALPPDELSHVPLVQPQTPGSTVTVLEWSQSRRRLHVTMERPGRLGLRTYHFPGWSAKLSKHEGAGGAIDSEQGPGESLPVRAEPGSGRLLLDVPAGNHEIVMCFESTPPRIAGAVLSATAALTWIILALVLARDSFHHAFRRAQGARHGLTRY